MNYRVIFAMLFALTACGTSVQDDQLDTDEPAWLGHEGASSLSMMSRTAACAVLDAQIKVTHAEATTSPQWQALAESEAWQQQKQQMGALKACKAQPQADCTEQQSAFDAAWQRVEESAEFAAARATPLAKALNELVAEATALHCWEETPSEPEQPEHNADGSPVA